MRYFTRTLMMAALVLIPTLTASAQGKETAGGKKRFKHDEKIQKEYDRSKDQTTLKLQMTPITCVRDGCLFFSLEASFPGTKPKAVPDRFVLALYIFTKTLEPFTNPTLVGLLDGESVELGEMTFAGKDSKGELTGMAYGIILDDKMLARLAKARKVEMRLGGLQFELKENKLNAIADFYNQATPEQPEN